MYIPKFYKNNNIDEVKNFICENGFGILVSRAQSKLWATHIPLELDKNENGNDVLYGHISKGNPQWKNFSDKNEVLAIFHGPHAYISSSWYNHENVSTWNYIAVHIYGKIKIIEGKRLIEVLKKLTDKYESKSKKPVSVNTLSEKFLHREIKGIVGFEIVIDEIQSAYKLSQNRDEVNHETIIKELENRGDPNSLAIASEMKKHKK